VWFGVGTLVKYGDVIGMSMGLPADQKPDPGRAVMWCYVGLALGDLASGLLSQRLRSRRGAVLVFHLITIAAMVFYFTMGARSVVSFYAACLLVGLGCGYWAVFATAAAEQFGTNLRATAATTAPNLVRWSAAASAGLWVWFERIIAGGQVAPEAPWKAAVATGVAVMALAGLGLVGLRETYGIDLDYEEA
jgi:MFS family permease